MCASLEVLFAPAEFAALTPAALSHTTCVVFDILRATSSMMTALGHGATRIHPVREIADALALKQRLPDALLAGERDGVRILSAQTGSIDFDLGNSPREFTAEKVRGREIIMTTTNGTRALQACIGAPHILAGSLLNLGAVAACIVREQPARVLLVCAGTFEETAYEDTWAAGALCELLQPHFSGGNIADSAHIAREVFLTTHTDPMQAMLHSRNARRLRENPALCGDVEFCLRRDVWDFVAEMRNGALERMPQTDAA
jgi:2-phosphosulfolactate phosphatase